jgi:hypothetical protein
MSVLSCSANLLRSALSVALLAGVVSVMVVACSNGASSLGGMEVVDSGLVSSPEGSLDAGMADAEVPEVIGCDAGASSPGGCGYLDVTLSGGFSASDCCYGCGADMSGFSWMIDEDQVGFEIDFPQGQTPFEQTGTFPLDSVLINEGYGDGGVIGWQTPPGACTVTIMRSVCTLVPSIGQSWDWLTGSGHCTQPAEPTLAKGPAPPVSISDFTFRGYVLLP